MTETGRTLRMLRRDAGLTLRALGAIVGCSAQFLCEIEYGQRKFPLARIAALPEAMREPIQGAARADIVAEFEAKLGRVG